MILVVYNSMGNDSYIENKSVRTTVLLCATFLEVIARHFGFCSGIIMVRGSLTEIMALCVLTSSIVESAYKHVSGIYCRYLQGGSEWCVLWSVYVGTLIASETHVICRP
jgi:hypothetical protein